MSDVKNVLLTLCKYINSLIKVGLTIEHIRLAKHDALDEDAIEKLWNALHILSYHAAREKRSDIDFRDYDTLTAVKLHLAFLQYPAIRFYSLSRGSNRSRDSLIALAWLLGTQDVLTTIFRIRLTNSVLGAECTHVAASEVEVSHVALLDKRRSSMSTQLDNILHLNAKVNLNLKEISELIREKSNLVSKVHAASIGVSGLPHLCVSELALAKRILTRNSIDDSGNISEDDRQRLREFHDAGTLLDLRAKWLAKQDMFFNWMITVIQEHEGSNSRIRFDSRELASFSSLLRYIVSDRLRMLTSEPVDSKYRSLTLDCPSRAYRSQCNEEENCLDELNELQNDEQEKLRRNSELLADELKKMLELIPSSIHI